MEASMRLFYASLLAVVFAAPVLAGPDTPKDFVSDAIKGDNSEITLGRMAQRAGASAGIRDFGRRLVADHLKARREAVAVARGMRLDPPDGMMMKARAEQAKLELLSGNSFDREFAAYMIGDHQDDIAEFSREADRRRGPTSALAAKQLPALRAHLALAQALMRKAERR
jgi:putative membrane protein